MEQHNTAQSGGVVYSVQGGDQFVYTYRERPPYRVEPFVAEPPPAPDALVRRAPSWLLAARHRVVPFHGRDDDLARLRDWRDNRAPGVSVRLVHAPGGQGKTRFAAQFGGASTRAGWIVATARHRSEVAAAAGADQQLAVYRTGLLIILDYAERWPLDDLIKLLQQHQSAAVTPIRVLLIARSGGGWWQSLVYQLRKLGIADAEEWELAALAEHLSDRQAIYVAARDRFASVFGVAVSITTPGPDLGSPRFDMVLALHMKALVDVDAASRGVRPPSGQDQAGLSSYLLAREHDYWQAAYHNSIGAVRTSELAMARAVYTATLTRALSHDDGVIALTRAKIGEATNQPVDQVLEDHKVLYPPTGSGTYLEPLYPDRLGEDFIALTTPTGAGTTGEAWAATLPAQLLAIDDDGSAPAYATPAIIVLVEAAARWPHLAENHLYPLLSRHPQLALAAGGATLARLVDIDGIDIAVLEAIERLLPPDRNVDLDLAAAAITRRLTDHRLDTVSDPAARARLYAVLAWRLCNADLHDQAMTPALETVQIYRRLTQTDQDAFEPELARALSNLCLLLSRLQHWAEAVAVAEEAAHIYRDLATANPARYEPDLAWALNNLSAGLADLYRRQDALPYAEEAVSIYRRLTADLRFDQADLAWALNNLGFLLEGLHRREEALAMTQEARWVYKRLAVANPARFEPDLAGVLFDAAALLQNLGRPEDALAAAREAVDVYRGLAAANPRFGQDLAGRLNDVGIILQSLGRLEDALAATQDAAGIYRRLAVANPKFERDLADVLRNLSSTLRKLGRQKEQEAADAELQEIENGLRPDLNSVPREQILAMAKEAAMAYRRLAADDPRYEGHLARTLQKLSTTLSDMGQQDEALAAAEEAAPIWRRMTETGQLGDQPLIDVLRHLLSLQLDRGLRDKAMRVEEEVVEIYRRSAMAISEPTLARELNFLGSMLWDLHRCEEAMTVLGEAKDIYQRLAAANPARFEPDLASLLTDEAHNLWMLGRQEEELAAVEEAVEVYRGLAAADAQFAPHLASALQRLSTLLPDLGHPEAASAAARPVGKPHRDGGKDLVRRNRSAFIVLLRDNDEANGVKNLLSDIRLPESEDYAIFSAPPIRGLDFFTANGLTNWSDENIPPDAIAVYLLDHEPGLANQLKDLPGVFYVGVPPESSASAEYSDSVRTFSAPSMMAGPAIIMSDYSLPTAHHGAIFNQQGTIELANFTTISNFAELLGLPEGWQLPRRSRTTTRSTYRPPGTDTVHQFPFTPNTTHPLNAGNEPARAAQSGPMMRSSDVKTECALSSIDAALGATVTLRLTGEGPCAACQGTGAASGTVPRICPTCGGIGLREPLVRVSEPCRTCTGRGLVVDYPCLQCSESGRAANSLMITTRIPAGVKDGQWVRLKGKVPPGAPDSPAGDIYIQVHVEP
jgi:tetratricopeptide (TPR) repeat protein